jgi:hypothetical protein
VRRRRDGLHPGTPTVVLAVVAAGSTAAVVAFEYGRVWKRGNAPLPAEADDPLEAAAEAAAETAEVARVGYREAPQRENALFNLLGSFVVTFITARMIAYGLRGHRSVGPFRNLIVGRRHIHHFVPGIALTLGAGGASIALRSHEIDPWLALPFGAGAALIVDETALLIELEDVYWSEKGMLSMDVSFGVTCVLAVLALVVRLLRRGRLVVEGADVMRAHGTGGEDGEHADARGPARS